MRDAPFSFLSLGSAAHFIVVATTTGSGGMIAETRPLGRKYIRAGYILRGLITVGRQVHAMIQPPSSVTPVTATCPVCGVSLKREDTSAQMQRTDGQNEQPRTRLIFVFNESGSRGKGWRCPDCKTEFPR
jgi:hypothetical protein